jgi:hypothetical protein
MLRMPLLMQMAALLELMSQDLNLVLLLKMVMDGTMDSKTS